MTTTKFVLLIIILIALLTRLPFLDLYPNGLSADEAQQSYDGYSILKTGKDEWGQFLPLNPRGFGDYKPPIYTYLTVPSIAILGLNVFSARLPAALFGVLTVLVVYYFGLNFFRDQKIALAIAFLLAISPWHIQVSRTAFEGGIGIFLFITGFVFFTKTGLLNHLIKLDKKYLILCLICWGLCLYTYQSFRLFIALFILAIYLLFRKQIKIKELLISIVILTISALPIVLNFTTASTRLADVSIWSHDNIQSYLEHRVQSDGPIFVSRIFDNKYTFIAETFFNNYLTYFSPTFLFTGDRPDFSYLNFPKFPLFYFPEIIFLLAAFYYLLIKRSKNYLVLIFWVLLSPIPAAVTTGNMHANRGIILLPILTILSGLGLKVLVDLVQARFPYKKLIITSIAILLMFINFIFFEYFYFFELPKISLESLRTGYDQVFKNAISLGKNYNQVVIDKTVFSEPQIFLAFYGKIDPNIFQQASQDWLRYQKSDKLYVDQLDSYNLGNFLFESVDWSNKDRQRINSLVISKADNFPTNISSTADVNNPQCQVQYKLVSTPNK